MIIYTIRNIIQVNKKTLTITEILPHIREILFVQ